jgi:hypothetical protein
MDIFWKKYTYAYNLFVTQMPGLSNLNSSFKLRPFKNINQQKIPLICGIFS